MKSLRLEEINAELLQELGLEDPQKALRILQDLAGQGVTDDDLEPLLPLLLEALKECADPDRALGSFVRWFQTLGSRYSYLQLLIRHPVALRVFCLVTGSSQYFADLLAKQPEYFEIIANPGVRGGAKSAATFYREAASLIGACQQVALKKDALRRWKAREMLRIGVRDLVGIADMPATAREFSNLADACIQCAYDIACAALPLSPNTAMPPFAIIGMGKLGGRELNYSSDIDLVFVHGDDLPYEIMTAEGRRIELMVWLGRFAENLIKILAEDNANGHVFRVDMRLRPEGRFGPLTRSLSGFRAYYDSWAENWERQALLKARFIAGDRALGESYMRLVETYVFRRHVTSAFIQDVIENKRRIEKHCDLEGQTETNVKTGFGGIRDIEFIVQLLQLELGGGMPRLRTGNTLEGLRKLQQARRLKESAANALAEDYQFLRNLEHRLQLLHGFQTQNMPPADRHAERRQIARRMGFSEREPFEEELALRRQRVHNYAAQLFYGRNLESASPQRDEEENAGAAWNDLLDIIETDVAQKRLSELLKEAGFRNIPNALRALQLPMRGNEFGEMPPDTPQEFKRVASRLLDLCAQSPDPDAALAGIEALATAVPNRAQLYASFDDSPEVMERLVALAGSAPHLLKRLERRLEWLESLFAEEEEEPLSYAEKLRLRLRGIKRTEAQLEAMARFYQRETLLIGAQEAWGDRNTLDVMQSLTALAEAMLETLLNVCAAPLIEAHTDPEFAQRVLVRVAVIGLGKLGGGELGYSSDWDVVFVYADSNLPEDKIRHQDQFALANSLVESVLAAGKTLIQKGAQTEIDLRLRPWGRAGAVLYALSGFLKYYHESMETWERQASLKARFVAGSLFVGKRFERILRLISFGRGVDAQESQAICNMKRRIENERVKPEQRHTDLKLGWGGMSDVEWLAQHLQLRNGRERRTLWEPNTLQALSALATGGFLDNAETDVLGASYLLLTQTRNALWLMTGKGADALPVEGERRRVLARLLGYRDRSGETAEERLGSDVQIHMNEIRRIFERRFYAG